MTALVVGSLLACKQKKAPDVTPAAPSATASPDIERAKKLQPQIQELMKQLAAAAKKAAKEPKVKSDRPLKTKLEKGKFVILGDKWLTEPQRDAAADELKLDNTVLFLCTHGAEKAALEANDVKYFEECLGWDYIAVVRPRRLDLPKVKMGTSTFAPGSFKADMLLFEVKSGEIKGRYQMGITNSDKLTYPENSTEAEWDDKAKRDLIENVIGVIEERMQLETDSMGS